MVLVVNETRRISLGGQIRPARSFWQRLLGLLDRKTLRAGQGLWIPRCQSIHTLGMRFGIDVVFLDKSHRVVDLRHNVKPNRLLLPRLRAKGVLELPTGILQETSTTIGDQLRLSENLHPA